MVKKWILGAAALGGLALLVAALMWTHWSTLPSAPKVPSVPSAAASAHQTGVDEKKGDHQKKSTVRPKSGDGVVYDFTSEDISNLATRPGSGNVIVMVFAEWCGYCKKMHPEYEKAAAELPQYTWGRLNSGTCPELVSELGVISFPTTLHYRDGKLIHTFTGARDATGLIQEVVMGPPPGLTNQ